GKGGRHDDSQRGQGGYKPFHVASPVIEISREETAKRAELFPQVEGQSLISDNVFLKQINLVLRICRVVSKGSG
ncbi:MAG: hypothetical protein WA770_05080, partial [Pseudolabrys sp.]